MWTDLFIPGVPLLEKIVRPLLVYAFLIVGLRLAGKRELAQLNPFDLVVLLTISNTVQNAIIGNDNSVSGGVIGAATLLLVNALVVRFLYRHERFNRLVEGNPTTLIEGGRVVKDGLDAELITVAELEAAAHRQGFDSLDEVDRAAIEPGGMIAFFRRRPPTDALRQEELLARLDQIQRTLAEMRRE